MEQQTDHVTLPTSSEERRPTIITVLCVWNFLANLHSLGQLGIPSVREAIIEQYGVMIFYHDCLALSLALIAIIGFWEMHAWGVYLYTTLIISSTVCGLIVYTPIYILVYSKIIPIIMSCIGFRNLKRMT